METKAEPQDKILFNQTDTVKFFTAIEIPIEVEVGNLYDGYQIKFTEPFEKVYFIFRYGVVIMMTNHLATMIIPPDLKATFSQLGLKFEDLIIVIHNHLRPSTFSSMDKRFYMMLREKGFTGSFQLFIQPTKKIYELHFDGTRH